MLDLEFRPPGPLRYRNQNIVLGEYGEYMVTILIDRLPEEWQPADVYELLNQFRPSHVFIAVDVCGNCLCFAFAFFSNEEYAQRALLGLRRLDVCGRALSVVRAVSPRTPGEMTG